MKVDDSTALKAIRLYESGLSQREVGQRLGLAQRTICNLLHRGGKQARPSGPARRHTLNEAYFSEITTGNQAYWLGFLAADGYVIRNSSGLPTGVGVHLAIADVAHLEKLAECVGSDAPVRTFPGSSHVIRQGDSERTIRGTGSARIQFFSAALARDLGRYGITPSKTLTCAPWSAPPHLAPHYWRGAIDGDGYVSSGNEVVFVGTRAMCEAFADFAKAACGTTTRPQPNRKIWKVQIGGRGQLHALLTVLYGNDGIALDRKRCRALSKIAEPYERRTRAPCKVPGCGRSSVARKLCNKHYQQRRNYGDGLKPDFDPTACASEGCSLSQVAKGYCSKHYARWRRHGDPLGGRPYYRLSDVP